MVYILLLIKLDVEVFLILWLLEEQFGGDIPTMTEVNDFIRFGDDFIFDALGIRIDEEEEEEE